MPAETSYRRRMPAEWAELVSLADTKLDQTDNRQPTIDTVDTVWNAAKTLDNEPLEIARYYGLGLAMCGLARQLRQEETKTRIIDAAAKRIIFTRTLEGRPHHQNSLAVDDLRVEAMFGPFDAPVRESLATLTKAEILTMDVLGTEAHEREKALVLGKPRDDLVREYKQTIINGNLTQQVLRNNAAAAMISLLRTVLSKKHRAETSIPHQETRKVSMLEITKPTTLADLVPISLAISSATLRRDEFVRDLDSYIDIHEGTGVFNRAATSRVVDLEAGGTRDNTVLHQSRLKCPALSVQGLVPDVAEIVIEAIETAQAQVSQPPYWQKRN